MDEFEDDFLDEDIDSLGLDEEIDEIDDFD